MDILTELIEKPNRFLILESRNRSGDITNRRKVPMHSMTQNYWAILNAALRSEVGPNVLNSGGFAWNRSSNNMTSQASNGRLHISCGEGEYQGVLLGGGTTSVRIDDYSLETPIPLGENSGELVHLECFVSLNSDGRSVSINRAFENLSGGDIEINEIGIFLRNKPEDENIMIARDVLDNTFTVANGEVVTIQASLYISEGTRNVVAPIKEFNAPNEFASLETEIYPRSGGVGYQNPFDIPVEASASNDSRGILLGTGDAPIEFEDIDLDSRIQQGNSIGQLLYGACTVEELTINTTGNYLEFYIYRTFLNDSGGSIEVKELGLFASSSEGSLLLYRFILPSSVLVEDGQNRQARIKFRYTMT